MTKLTTEVVASTDTINENMWNNVVKQSDLGSVFHRTEWLGAVEKALNSDPRHILVKKGNNYIGLLPNFIADFELPVTPPDWADSFVFKRLVSVAPGFGGPVVATDEDTVIRELFDTVGSICSGNIISHRMYAPDTRYVRYARYLESVGYDSSALTCRFVIDIDDRPWEAIKSDFEKTRRRNVRRGENYDYEVSHEPLKQDTIPAFYRTYQRNMDRTGAKVFPKAFFHELADRMSAQVELFTFAVDDDPLGYHIVIHDETRNLLIDFFLAVEEAAYDYYPHEVLTKHIVKWAKDKGIEQYSLGSTKAHYDDGIYSFKSRFGGDVRPVLSWEQGYVPGKWHLFKLARWAYRRRYLEI